MEGREGGRGDQPIGHPRYNYKLPLFQLPLGPSSKSILITRVTGPLVGHFNEGGMGGWVGVQSGEGSCSDQGMIVQKRNGIKCGAQSCRIPANTSQLGDNR